MIENIVETGLPIDERLLVKRNCIRNGNGPKRIAIVTGTHGDELEGQYVCFKLAQTIQQHINFLNGRVDIYPCLNPLGMDSIERGVPGFDLDMNRIFPGNSEGSMAEAAAHAILESLKGADVVIDIHSSNIFLREVPQVRINVNNAAQLVPMAEQLNMDFIWVHEAATVLEATLAHSLNSTGTPCLVVEMGVGMRISTSMGEQLTCGILNLMKQMGMWTDDAAEVPTHKAIISEGDLVSFVNADASGIFIPDCRNDVWVQTGDALGRIVSPLTGDVLHYVKAPEAGYLFTIRAYPVVYEGSLIARIHRK